MKFFTVIKSVVLALVVCGLGAKHAFAYIDPNAGGLMFQLLSVIFVVFSVILLTISAKIKMIFARVKRFARNLFIKQHQTLRETSGNHPAPGYKSPADEGSADGTN
jgi:hypothetical protein